MFSSLPDYRRFGETVLQRMHKDPKQPSSNRLVERTFNILLLAALWGVPLYARWVVVPYIHRPKIESPSSPSIVGKWKTTKFGNHFSVTFTEDGQFVVSWKDTVLETARYSFADDNQHILVLENFRKQPGDLPFADKPRCELSVSVESKKLSTRLFWDDAEKLRRNPQWFKDWHGDWKFEGEALTLGLTDFERVE